MPAAAARAAGSGMPYDVQLVDKQRQVEELLPAASPWLRAGRERAAGLPQQGQDGRPRHRRGPDARDPPGPGRRRASTCATARCTRRASRRRSRCSRTFVTRAALDAVRRAGAARRAEAPAGDRVAGRRADGAVRAALAGAGRPDPQAPALAAGVAAGAGRRVGEPPARAQGDARGRARAAADRAGDAAHARRRDRPAPAAAELLPDQHRDGGRALPAGPRLGGRGRAAHGVGPLLRRGRLRAARWPAPARDVPGIEISREAVASADAEPRRGRARRTCGSRPATRRRTPWRPRGARPIWWS